MAKTKDTLTGDFPRSDSLEVVVGRVKRDMLWLLVSCAVAIGSGLLVGNLVKF